jgi:hypothetical protein
MLPLPHNLPPFSHLDHAAQKPPAKQQQKSKVNKDLLIEIY